MTQAPGGDVGGMPPATPRSADGTGRVVALVCGALLVLPALVAVLAAVTLFALQALVGEDGYLMAPTSELRSNGYALVSEPIELEDVDAWPFDDSLRVRIAVDAGPTARFVGIARAIDVERALGSVERGVVHDIDRGPGSSADVEQVGTERPQGPPAELLPWAASAAGSGEQQLEWTPTSGDWVVVVMNADASAGVYVAGRAGVHVPYLDVVAWTLLGIGIVLGALAALLVTHGARGTQREPRSPAELGTRDAAATSATPAQPARSHATTLSVAVDGEPSRWLWIVKWILLVPHAICLAVLWAALLVTTTIAFFAILLTGHYPRALFDFACGVLRWTWRVAAYSWGAWATDRYPPFSLRADTEHPATFDVAYPERHSRGLVLVKSWLLAIPHYVIAGAVTVSTGSEDGGATLGLAGAVSLVMLVGLLFTGRLPRGLLDLLVGVQRWGFRVASYVLLLTDRYPPLRLDQGTTDPSQRSRA